MSTISLAGGAQRLLSPVRDDVSVGLKSRSRHFAPLAAAGRAFNISSATNPLKADLRGVPPTQLLRVNGREREILAPTRLPL